MDTTIWPSPTVAFGLRASGVAGSADETVAALREMERLVKQQLLFRPLGFLKLR